MAKIFTIGHSNHNWTDFTATLKDNHIDVVIDVRRNPGYKTCPQFNKGEMIKALKEENVSYIHIEKLGGRRSQIPKDQNMIMIIIVDGKTIALKPYANYMATISFRVGIHEILSLMINYDNLAIMCAEAVPWHCHRRMIADYLTLVEGISVFDIIIGSKKQPPQLHQLTSFAHLTDRKTSIIYPKNRQINKVNENRIQHLEADLK